MKTRDEDKFRDRVAIAVVQAYFTQERSGGPVASYAFIAKVAYQMADALVDERNGDAPDLDDDLTPMDWSS